jgi:hypothetical protein
MAFTGFSLVGVTKETVYLLYVFISIGKAGGCARGVPKSSVVHEEILTKFIHEYRRELTDSVFDKISIGYEFLAGRVNSANGH